jgi:hypothetical protein
LHAANLLDEEPKRGIDEVLIQLAGTNARGKRDLPHFARHARAEPNRRPQHALGDGQQVCLDGHVLFRRDEANRRSST